MPPVGLINRVKKHLNAQMACCAKLLAEYDGLESGLAAADLTKLLARTQRHTERLAALAEQEPQLLARWRAAQDVPESDQAAVRALAERVRAVAAQAEAGRQQALARVAQARAENIEAQRALKQGRDMLDKYRVPNPHPRGFLDRSI